MGIPSNCLKVLISVVTLVSMAGCASQQVTRETTGVPGSGSKSSHTGQRDDSLRPVEAAMRARLASTDGVVITGAGSIVVRVAVSAIFRADASELANAADDVLQPTAATLVAYPETRVEVRAYSDDLDLGPAVTALTQARAEAVAAYLVSQGVARQHIRATGEGAGAPVTGNSTSEQRRANRRIEIVISSLSS